MRAAVIWNLGDPFDVREDASRDPAGPGQVAVRIRAAGVCQTDLSLAGGAFGQSAPVVLGHEGAGDIVEVGAGVTDVSVGDRVLITWVPACGQCYNCIRHETYICSNRKRSSDQATTSRLQVGGTPVQAGLGTGTFAEETVVPASGVIRLPDDIPFEYAAILGCAVPTGFGAAVNSGQIRPGDSVLVIGCGAVGLSALQGARIAGAAELVAVDPLESRRALALSLGATHAFDPDGDPTSALVDSPGFDVVIDAVARSSTITAGWRAARRGGRLVVVGAGRDDDLVQFSAQDLFHEEKKIIGSYYGASDMRREVPRLISLWRAGRLDLSAIVDGVADLDRINDVVSGQRAGTTLRTILTL
ncbi:Zn-dependent alcohol dehydrogenase [Rhodococcus globerulus]|uniref:Zn-dependent alcohol dehydrogenase n=1 Tax=Rhodococcus globerulus TaxID=33008 RepID=UPI001F2CEE16|nr:Zn-dependent alcohol dehydrogenase [Rhodococcus globerulus]MCE4266310.1 Zn-dependent alcohol dehydrogenase [Rhodococcus globerulus]